MMLASQSIKEEDIGTANSTLVEVRDPHWNSSILPWDEWTPPNACMEITFTIECNGYGYGFEGVPNTLTAAALAILPTFDWYVHT